MHLCFEFHSTFLPFPSHPGVFTIDGFGDGALNEGALSTGSLTVSPLTKVSGPKRFHSESHTDTAPGGSFVNALHL